MNTLGKKILITVLLNLLFIAANTFSLEAADLNHMLQGEYIMVSTLTCVSSSGGFNENLTRIGGGGIVTSHSNGLVTFDGNGNGTLVGTTIVINPIKLNDGEAPVTPNDTTSTFTYTVDTNGFYQSNSVITSTRTGGPSSGVTITISGIRIEGQLSSDGETLLISDTNPNIEVITLPDESTVDRICGRTGTIMKIKAVQPKVVVVPLL